MASEMFANADDRKLFNAANRLNFAHAKWLIAAADYDAAVRRSRTADDAIAAAMYDAMTHHAERTAAAIAADAAYDAENVARKRYRNAADRLYRRATAYRTAANKAHCDDYRYRYPIAAETARRIAETAA